MVEQNYFSTQRTIESPKARSIAQGTIEYLVIIAIVVVISLVVVALLLGVLENNSDVGGTAQQVSNQLSTVALNDAVLGTGTDANGLIVLTNNTGELIKNVRISIDGKDHNYFGINIPHGNKTTFQLNTLEIPCPEGQDKIIKTITIKYTTKNNLEKTQTIENTTLQCNPNQNPQTTNNPINEKQQNEEEGDTGTPEEDQEAPQITGVQVYSEDYKKGDEITFKFSVNDESGLNYCALVVDGEEKVRMQEGLDSSGEDNYLDYDTGPDDLGIGSHNYYIECEDSSNNVGQSETQTFNLNLCYNWETELYGECYENVVAYWPLNETSGSIAVDYAGFDNNGTIEEATFGVEGKVGTAYYYEGTEQKVTVSDNSNLQFGTNNFTIVAWVKKPDTTFARILYKSGYQNSSGFTFDDPGNGHLRFGIRHPNYSTNEYQSNFIISDNKWHHVVAVRDGTTVRIYMDNQKEEQTNYFVNGNDASGTGQPVLVGTDNIGTLDEVILFNRALSDSEIEQLYYNSGGQTITEQLREGLIGYWPFEDNANDYSESGNYDLTYASPSYVTGVVGRGVLIPGIHDLRYYPHRSTDDSIFDVPSNGSLTVCAWAKKTTTISSSAEAIVAKEDETNPYPGWLLFLHPTNECGPVTNAVGLDTIWSNSSRRLARATIQFPTNGKWQHVCGVIDRSNEKIYIYQQGNDVTYNSGSTNYCSRSITNLGELNAEKGLGVGVRDPQVIHNKFNGNIDEVAIWNRALSAEEISALYNNGEGLSLIQ